jgi:uncharacterized protein YdhG (YjbR/CyaY superfamily)
MMIASKPKNIDEYIAGFPPEVQDILQQIRTLVREIVPACEEKISYGIPTFTLNNHYLVYVAAYKNHLSLHPAPAGEEAVSQEIDRYRKGKGTLQFPLNQPVPYDLIARFVKFRCQKNQEEVARKRRKK